MEVQYRVIQLVVTLQFLISIDVVVILQVKECWSLNDLDRSLLGIGTANYP